MMMNFVAFSLAIKTKKGILLTFLRKADVAARFAFDAFRNCFEKFYFWSLFFLFIFLTILVW